MRQGRRREQGTKQQAAAAAALHNLNWRYHAERRRWYHWAPESASAPEVCARAG